MAKERNLPSKTTLTTSDYIRVVGSDNASYKQGVPSLMNTMGVVRTLISDNTDFDSLVPNATLGTGYYRGNNVSTMTNKPSPEVNAFPWALDAIEVSGYVKQILHVYTAAGNIVTYERIQYYSSGSRLFAAWEKMPTRAEIDALNSKTTGEVSKHSDISGGTLDSNALIKIGNTVFCSARIFGISATANGAFFTIPPGFRPSQPMRVMGYIYVNGTAIPSPLTIATDGTISLAYSASQTLSQIGFAGSWTVK